MNKIYSYKTGALREIVLDPGEQEYLCRLNLAAIKDHNKETEKLNETVKYETEGEEVGC